MDSVNLELLLMIMKSLEDGPFREVAEKLRMELGKQLNETRLDYLGNQHQTDLNNLLAKFPNINSKTLLNMCQHLKKNLDEHVPPSVHGINSLLGAGQFSLLRTRELLHKESVDHSVKSLLSTKHFFPAYKNYTINVVKHLQARKQRGPVCIRRSVPTEIYSRITLHRKLMGHLSSVYCVCFDQTGNYIFTGADDHLIKIWSAKDGRLLKTLRGHEGEITDMSVNYENRLLASGGMDRVIRIWDLKTSKLLDCLNAHNAMVTSVKFAPYNRHLNFRYLISTSNDGSVIIWSYHVDKLNQFKKVKKYQERNCPGGRIVCSSFSTGGSFLACGSSDNFIHVYGFHPDMGPYWLAELNLHRDQVDSIQFSNQGFRFITGSQDGTAVIWTYKGCKWMPRRLDMNTQLDQTIPHSPGQPPLKVLIVQWSRDDRYVMTSIIDYSIKVWDSQTGRLVHILKEHKHDVYLIESHPTDPRIFISASHDGTMIIWDLERGKVLKRFQNRVDIAESHETAPLGSIYDIKFSPDGNMIAATDSYGYLSLFGTGSSDPYLEVPEQMFFHTDYRALIRDLRHFVMDEQTHVAPHLMPRPTLVDMNGNPYPTRLQRFVPDYRDGERIVVAPLSETQINCIAEMIANHSKQEDDEYIHEKRSPADDLVRRSESSSNEGFNNHMGECSGYQTRYSTRYSFRSARSNFMPRSSRTARSRQVHYNEDDDEDELGYRQPQQQQRQRPRQRQQPQQRQRQRPTQNEVHSDSSTEEDYENDEDTEEETETEVESDDETVIDSEATEIDDSNIADYRPSRNSRPIRRTRSSGAVNNLSHSREPERPVRRCSARLRDRKRFRRS